MESMREYIDFNAFRKDVEDALEGLTKKYGVSIRATDIRYDEAEFSLKLKVQRADVDVEKLKFENDVRYMTGFTADDYCRQVEIKNGKKSSKYVIKGFKPGNKYSVCVEREDGASYAFTAEAVLSSLGRIPF